METAEPEETRPGGNKRNNVRERVLPEREQAVSYCETQHGTHHVPAKVVALFTCPDDTTQAKALVHACRPWMQKNYDRTSAITESWHLQYYKELGDVTDPITKVTNHGKWYTPVYAVINADELKENIFCIEESPGLPETIEIEPSAGHVIFITDRISHWPGLFF